MLSLTKNCGGLTTALQINNMLKASREMPVRHLCQHSPDLCSPKISQLKGPFSISLEYSVSCSWQGEPQTEAVCRNADFLWVSETDVQMGEKARCCEQVWAVGWAQLGWQRSCQVLEAGTASGLWCCGDSHCLHKQHVYLHTPPGTGCTESQPFPPAVPVLSRGGGAAIQSRQYQRPAFHSPCSVAEVLAVSRGCEGPVPLSCGAVRGAPGTSCSHRARWAPSPALPPAQLLESLLSSWGFSVQVQHRIVGVRFGAFSLTLTHLKTEDKVSSALLSQMLTLVHRCWL